MSSIKNLLVVLVLVGVLLFSGCSSNGDANSERGFTIGGGSSGGSSSGGVDVSFAEGNPPQEMFKGQPYNFAFVFTNNQKHEIKDLKMKLKGFDAGYVSGLALDQTIGTLPKATTQTGAGVYAGHVVAGVVLDGFVGDYSFNPTFDYCYSAKSIFTSQVCVPSKKNQCDTDVKTTVDQNGPLSLSVSRINALQSSIRVDFAVSNSLPGKVVNTCFKTDDYAVDFNLVQVKLGSVVGDCTSVSGKMQVIGDSANFYCEFARSGSDESYASQITAELAYAYQESTQKSITVKDLNAGYN